MHLSWRPSNENNNSHKTASSPPSAQATYGRSQWLAPSSSSSPQSRSQGSIPVPRHGMAHPASWPITNNICNEGKERKEKKGKRSILLLAKTSPSLQFVICRRFVKLIWALFRSAAASSQVFFSLSSHHSSYRWMDSLVGYVFFFLLCTRSLESRSLYIYIYIYIHVLAGKKRARSTGEESMHKSTYQTNNPRRKKEQEGWNSCK